MILHKPKNFAMMKSCWKRAERFEGWGRVKGHPLEPAFRNCMMMADVGKDATPEDLAFSLRCLDWFAVRIDEYAKTHKLEGDRAIAKMLQSWKRRCFFNPTMLIEGRYRD